jgi:ATP-dependent DNA helicase DinG
MTSATLELGGSFHSIAGSVGLLGGDDEDVPWQGIDVGSPFDYPRQGICYVARHLPRPGRDGTPPELLDELADLMEAAGGRTLGLFSSMRAAERATEALRGRLDVPILCQGEDQTAQLVREFAGSVEACLFGTLSLWQGVDVPGSALQLVVIDRIPFPRPDDPLMSARAQAVDDAGGNGFQTVSVAHAALRLAQGAGRLIRTSTDRGVVAVLDSRMATARYAGFLRASLPAFWFTTDRAAALAALGRINESAPPPLPVPERAARPATGSARRKPRPPAPRPESERVAVVLGKAWTALDDGLLKAGVAAGRSAEHLAERHECSVEQLRARLDQLGLDVEAGA